MIKNGNTKLEKKSIKKIIDIQIMTIQIRIRNRKMRIRYGTHTSISLQRTKCRSNKCRKQIEKITI